MIISQKIAELMLSGWEISTTFEDGTYWVTASKGGTTHSSGFPDEPKFMANCSESVGVAICDIYSRATRREGKIVYLPKDGRKWWRLKR